ncbi:hypothetical protein IWW39_004514 [Coemansia spiralis]|uniref:Uncharacterized protein n=1 Tax=Coemansia spiralis TaxID=417178 RepID=A0A9W8GH67_9FUNG|nr:hypothetical protein IWW39_004514 [Coemansia spiralis]
MTTTKDLNAQMEELVAEMCKLAESSPELRVEVLRRLSLYTQGMLTSAKQHSADSVKNLLLAEEQYEQNQLKRAEELCALEEVRQAELAANKRAKEEADEATNERYDQSVAQLVEEGRREALAVASAAETAEKCKAEARSLATSMGFDKEFWANNSPGRTPAAVDQLEVHSALAPATTPVPAPAMADQPEMRTAPVKADQLEVPATPALVVADQPEVPTASVETDQLEVSAESALATTSVQAATPAPAPAVTGEPEVCTAPVKVDLLKVPATPVPVAADQPKVRTAPAPAPSAATGFWHATPEFLAERDRRAQRAAERKEYEWHDSVQTESQAAFKAPERKRFRYLTEEEKTKAAKEFGKPGKHITFQGMAIIALRAGRDGQFDGTLGEIRSELSTVVDRAMSLINLSVVNSETIELVVSAKHYAQVCMYLSRLGKIVATPEPCYNTGHSNCGMEPTPMSTIRRWKSEAKPENYKESRIWYKAALAAHEKTLRAEAKGWRWSVSHY